MYRIVGILAALACLAPAGFSQTQNATSNNDQQETIRALMQEVSELKARVSALEAKQNQPEQPPQQQPTPQPEVKVVPNPPQPIASGPEPFAFIRGIRFQGFASATYKASDANPPEEGASLGFRPGSAANFAIGDVDLFLTSQLSNRTSVLGEVVFSEQDSGEFETDVERLLLKYNPSDYLKMSFGRFHTATSYYNTVFHHGLWLQTAADRPLI